MRATLLSHAISKQTPLYNGEAKIKIKQLKSILKNESSNSLMIEFPNHSSTHVDMPYHFLKKGKRITDFLAKQWFFNKVLLLKIPIKKVKLIKYSEIQPLLSHNNNSCNLLLIKTGFEKFRGTETYWRSSPGLHPELAFNLKKKFPYLRAIGVDFISISSIAFREEGYLAHRNFLSQGIILLEDMKLSRINKAPDEVIVAPLLIKNADAAPATIFGIYS